VSRKTHFNAFTALQVLKGRIVAEWLEARGFDTFLEERRFGAWTRRAEDEPSVALCGVENALARTALEKPGFGLVVESRAWRGTVSMRARTCS
jgi:hypothetical protein